MASYCINRSLLASIETYSEWVREIIHNNRIKLLSLAAISPFSRYALHVQEMPTALDGSIRSPTSPLEGPYKDFFLPSGRYFKQRNSYILRGDRYLAAISPEYEVRMKLSIYRRDLYDALDILSSHALDRDSFRWHRLSVADYAKNAAITLLNAHIQREKVGDFHLSDQYYMVQRSEMIELAVSCVRLYWMIVFGEEDPQYRALRECISRLNSADEVIAHIETNYTRGIFSSRYLVRPEISHPKVLASAVGLVIADRRCSADTVLGMPSGGT